MIIAIIALLAFLLITTILIVDIFTSVKKYDAEIERESRRKHPRRKDWTSL